VVEKERSAWVNDLADRELAGIGICQQDFRANGNERNGADLRHLPRSRLAALGLSSQAFKGVDPVLCPSFHLMVIP